MNPLTVRTNLLDFDTHKLIDYCARLGEKPFRARQLQQWIHQKGIADFSQMTTLAKALRQKLTASAHIHALPILAETTSQDGTRKWLLDAGNGNAIETVFIPEATRATLCISSQVGCAVNCAFCSTGKQGFNRNLTTAEIIGQLWQAEFTLRADYAKTFNLTAYSIAEIPRQISNVVIMGMGEPLLNFKNIIAALQIMLDDHAYGLSRRRITLSTSGVVPAIDRLAANLPVALAISLHAPNNELRDRLVPLNKKYPLEELLSACQRYLSVAPRGFITFEYCLLEDVNDQDHHAEQLIQLLQLPCKINLIPFNLLSGSDLKCASAKRIMRFSERLIQAGFVTTIRKTRGQDIDAACGQLAGKVHDKTNSKRIAIARAPAFSKADSLSI